MAPKVDGGWYVLDRDERAIKDLSPSGRVGLVFGGPGKGPGELERPLGIHLHKEILMVYDISKTGLVLYQKDGAYIDLMRLKRPGGSIAFSKKGFVIQSVSDEHLFYFYDYQGRELAGFGSGLSRGGSIKELIGLFALMVIHNQRLYAFYAHGKFSEVYDLATFKLVKKIEQTWRHFASNSRKQRLSGGGINISGGMPVTSAGIYRDRPVVLIHDENKENVSLLAVCDEWGKQEAIKKTPSFVSRMYSANHKILFYNEDEVSLEGYRIKFDTSK